MDSQHCKEHQFIVVRFVDDEIVMRTLTNGQNHRDALTSALFLTATFDALEKRGLPPPRRSIRIIEEHYEASDRWNYLVDGAGTLRYYEVGWLGDRSSPTTDTLPSERSRGLSSN